jgi:hypothetical protein
MLSLKQFESLIERPESSILDFKKEMYNFDNDPDSKKLAEFVKDIISFSNTIRKESSYIIIGIEELPDKSKIFHGLNYDIDDAILQDKVKSKVHPRPDFRYYTIIYKEKKFGVFDFPVTFYDTPIYPVVKIKGLEPGKVYYRNGTSNTEALGLEVIKISDWLRTLADSNNPADKNEQISSLLKSLTDKNKVLSSVITDIYAIAQKGDYPELLKFCLTELKGINSTNRLHEDEIQYRIQTVYFALGEVSINPRFGGTLSDIKNELKQMEDVFEYKMLFPYPITKLESLLAGFKNSDRTLATISSTLYQLFPDKFSGNHATVNVLVFPDTLENLISNISQKAIDLLMRS